MYDFDNKFFESQNLQALVWIRYIDNIFFIWTYGEKSIEKFLQDLN